MAAECLGDLGPRIQLCAGTIRGVRDFLKRPGARELVRCTEDLALVLEFLEVVPASAGRISPSLASALRAELLNLRNELTDVRGLLEGAESFFAGWGRLQASRNAGYNIQGKPADLPPIHQVSLAG